MKSKSIAVVVFFAFALYLLTAGPAGATSYTLTLGAQGAGTVAANPTNANSTYPSGVTVTLTATPSNGWYFANWSGDTNGSVNPLNVAMNSSLNITGNFLAYPVYTLTLATNGQGAIALNPPGGSYLSNTLVTATATPAAGWVFTGWSGATNSSTNVVSMAVDANSLLTGTFAQLPAFDIQPGSVTNQTGGTVSFNAHATGSGTPAYSWFFAGNPLPGATNTTLSLANVTAGQAGNYWVVATNNYGSATSQVAALTLTNATVATHRVNSLDEGSLRAAFAQGGWIGFGLSGTVTLTNTITITNHVILDGGPGGVIISGGNAVRLFYVTNGASLTATNLTLVNGNYTHTNYLFTNTNGLPADAGAIYITGGTVTLAGCTLANNSAQALTYNGLARGGAIFNNGGTVLLYQSVITNNIVVGGGPGIPVAGSPAGTGLGGAIYNTNGSVTISACFVAGNLAQGVCIDEEGTGLDMGGAAFQSSGTMTILNSCFTLNQAAGATTGVEDQSGSPAYGGAVAVIGGNLAIESSQFVTNQALGTADGGYYDYHDIAGAACGGAVYCTATWNAADSTFAGNQAFAGAMSYGSGPNGSGGGIYNAGTLTLNRCAVYANQTQGSFGDVTEEGSGAGGDALGGGIFNAAQLAITNCTIALNSAVGGGAAGRTFGSTILGYATPGSAIGGGVFNNANATFLAMNVTIASNSCSLSSGYLETNGFAGGFQIANTTNGTLSVHNTLIAYSGTNSNAYGPITDGGYNICSDGSDGLSSGSSYNNTDPQLAPLGNYGGPTWCMALLSTSPAIDLGDFNGCPNTDQRGYMRPIGSAPDEGAYEYGSVPLVVPYLSLTVGSTNLLLSYTAAPPMTYYLLCSTNLTSWTCLGTNGPFAGQTNLSQSLGKPGLNRCYFRLLMQ